MPFIANNQVGSYKIARDVRLNRVVGLKRAQFQQEAQAIAPLNYPHIRQIYDIGRNTPKCVSENTEFHAN